VFDAAMLVALPEFSKEQLLATLLVYRVLYFVIPFATAISIMGTRELWLNVMVPWQQRRRLSEGFPSSAPASTAAPRPVERLEPLKRRKSRG
jgi:glycosyltransferase 2 family protein